MNNLGCTKNLNVYIFGNTLLDFDNLPIKLMPRLKETFPGINFIFKDPNENFHPQDGELIIIDTVVGPDDLVILHDIDAIEASPNYSMHDLDLGFTLKLLKKIGTLDKVTIFGLPAEMNFDQALEKLVNAVEQFISKRSSS